MHLPPSSDEVAADHFVNTVRTKARDDYLHTGRTIFTAAMAAQPTAPGLPFENLRMTMYRETTSALPPVPKSVDDIEVTGDWANTLHGQHLLLPGPDNNILIYTTDDNLQRLAMAPTWLMDGTF